MMFIEATINAKIWNRYMVQWKMDEATKKFYALVLTIMRTKRTNYCFPMENALIRTNAFCLFN